MPATMLENNVTYSQVIHRVAFVNLKCYTCLRLLYLNFPDTSGVTTSVFTSARVVTVYSYSYSTCDTKAVSLKAIWHIQEPRNTQKSAWKHNPEWARVVRQLFTNLAWKVGCIDRIPYRDGQDGRSKGGWKPTACNKTQIRCNAFTHRKQCHDTAGCILNRH
jgi:hypothetical protein